MATTPSPRLAPPFSAMKASSSFKQSLLKHMLASLRARGVPSNNMTILERKRAIKFSADLAMALARGGSRWSRAIVADLSRQEKSNEVTKEVFARLSTPLHACKIMKSRRIVKRSKVRKRHSKATCRVPASFIVKRMESKRTQVLKCLVPGGKSLNDEHSLLGETLDYIVSLQAQVDILQRLASTVENLNGRSYQIGDPQETREFSAAHGR